MRGPVCCEAELNCWAGSRILCGPEMEFASVSSLPWCQEYDQRSLLWPCLGYTEDVAGKQVDRKDKSLNRVSHVPERCMEGRRGCLFRLGNGGSWLGCAGF